MKKQDLKRLEGFHFRCLRKITRPHRHPGIGDLEIDRATKEEVFKAANLPIIEDMLREKRLRWFGHLVREKDGDPAKETLKQEATNQSKWFKMLKHDLEKIGLSAKQAITQAGKRAHWRMLTKALCFIGSNHGLGKRT